jgi:drug/metabolite transporter (DMT)-like permease
MKKAFIQLHIAVFLAGFTGILGRLISLNEGMIVWYRLLITTITMWILYGIANKIHRIPVSDILKIAAVGFIAAMHWITFYGSIKYSNVSVALVCFSAAGFFTSIFEPLVLRKKFDVAELLLGLMTLAGIYIIFHFDTRFKTGILIGIISALLGALFPILNRQFLQRINVETMLAWQQTGGFIWISLVLPFYLLWFPVQHFLPGLEDTLWLLVLSWLCSVVAFQFSSYALKRLSAFTVNLSYSLEPVYGILLAFIVFRENQLLSKWFYIGFAIIAAAIILHALLLIKQERISLARSASV